MDSYRTERQAAGSTSLAEEDTEVDPVQAGTGGQARDPEMDRLSSIIAEFNRLWGEEFSEPKRVTEIISRMPSQIQINEITRGEGK